MTEEPTKDTTQEEEAQVMVGFHPLGGVRLIADNVKLTPQEAFILAGQLTAHATMLIQMQYAQQAAEAQAMEAMMKNSGIVKPPGMR